MPGGDGQQQLVRSHTSQTGYNKPWPALCYMYHSTLPCL